MYLSSQKHPTGILEQGDFLSMCLHYLFPRFTEPEQIIKKVRSK